MRTIGVMLIVIGVLMMAINGINYKTEKNVIDIGTIKVSKEENRHVGWPSYTGGIIALAGIVFFLIPNKNK